MNPTAQLIINLINQYITNYALDAFQNLRLNQILQLMMQFVASSPGGGGTGNSSVFLPLISANFTNATDCPLTALNGVNFGLFWNENNRYLYEGIDYTVLVGGGFSIIIPGFNSATSTYHFYLITY